ncbi:Ste12-like transcription factor [Vairimorpha necatrix]|uniref:Ste12-like transcription factor n=1 Tax=Vairimorpha necatrix TaxID=6039 RepID=A0AAX4J8C1_9MICR
MLNKDKELFDFLSNAPKEFREGEQIKKYQMKNGDFIHCVLWNMHFYLTGTDIVKILLYRFQTSGRQLSNLKKFEEGIFSDLRNLKPGIDATLEGPRSEFLEFLYKNGCIRTQKKQKVFYWYSVPHDALFCDAMERDMRRETQMISYNKYVNSSGRMTPSPNFNMLRTNSTNTHFPRMESNNNHFFKEPVRSFDINNTNKYFPDYLRHTPTAPVRVYPEYDDYDQDAFYMGVPNKLTMDFYVNNHKQVSPSDISKTHKTKSLSIDDFDFLRERIESRSKTESENKVKKSKNISAGDNKDIFTRF